MSRVFKPLNRQLYYSLKRQFPRVTVQHAGEPAVLRYRVDYTRQYQQAGRRERTVLMEVDESGEEYLVDCPFCDDTRQRLSINHRWGLPDAKTGRRHLQQLLHCYNEECQGDYDNCRRLFREVYSDEAQQVAAARRFSLQQEEQPADNVRQQKLQVMQWPGAVVRLDRLATERPDHPAITYLEDRGLDPLRMGTQFHVAYCYDSVFGLARNRIVIPFFYRGHIVGWQCRHVGEWKKGDPPKYWTAPGFPRRQMCYGFEDALKHPTIAIVEGPFDRINWGHQAMALLGKTMSPQLHARLQKAVREDQTFVVALDPKQDAKSRAKGRPHHLDVLTHALQQRYGKNRVARILLPLDSDPGSLDRQLLFSIVSRQARQQDVPITLVSS